MRELNGNGKYCCPDGSLPSSPEQIGNIEAGDLMLYGDSCAVLFYESFSAPYRYTRIGKLRNTDGLAPAFGSGSAEVLFEKEE